MTNKIIAVVLIVVAAGAGFFGGMQYQKSQRSAAFGQGQFAGPGGQGGGGFRRFGAGGQNANVQAVRGQIVSADNGTVTIKMNDGSTKLVVLSGSTNVMKATKGSSSDLTAGQDVMVFGSSNSDGSVTAQSVQVGQMGGFGFGRNRPSGEPSPAH
jgi:hypothetical protein